MRFSGKNFWIVLAVAALLTPLLVYVVETASQRAPSLLYSDVLQTAIVLWAALCSLQVAKRSSGYLQQLWMLLATALFLCCAAQTLETYYQSIIHAPTLTPRPSDVLFILWVTPAVMMLLPRPPKESGTIEWQQVLDFAQIGVVAITAYLYFFYIPSHWEAEGSQMVLKIFRVQLLRDAALAAGFLIRARTVSKSSVRSFFMSMGGFFALASASDAAFLIAPETSPTGATWVDVAWCAPFLFITFIAAAWDGKEETLPLERASRFRTVVVSQALPILVPILVLFMGRSIAAEQMTIAWVAVTGSFILSGARLVLTNEKQRQIAEDLLRAEEALSRSQRMFSTAFRSTPDAIGISSIPGGQFLEVNDSFTLLTGYTREETLTKTPFELNLWKDPARRTQILSKLQKESEVHDEEFVCQTKSGESRICQFSGTLIVLDGKLCALAIVRDITDRKRAEEALQASEERFRSLVQDLHVGVVLLGPDAETKFANRAALAAFGMIEEQAVGKKNSNFGLTAISEEGIDIPFSLRPGPRAIATRRPIRNEVIGWRRPDSNKVLWTLVDAIPHLTADGEVASVILSISNITEWRSAEESLRASEERFRTLVREIDVGVVLLGPDSRIQFANEAAQQMFEISLEQAQGKTGRELDLIAFQEDGTEIPFSMRPGVWTMRTGKSVKDEVVGWRRPGSDKVFWTQGNAVPQFTRGGAVDSAIISFTNITERRKSEDALRQLSMRLLQLQDEERRRLGRELHDSLAQSVLAVNLNLAQAMRASTGLDERSRHALSEARRVLLEMSREIRTLSYLLHPPLLDELGLVSAVKEYVAGFSERSGIELELDIQAGFGRLSQEAETALFRIVQESLTNIQRHSGTKTAKIQLRGDTGRVNLVVIDQGCGMDKDVIERGNSTGTRLGVGILGMRERMTQLGGKLEIESSSSGTTVRVTIPVRTEVSDARSNPRSR